MAILSGAATHAMLYMLYIQHKRVRRRIAMPRLKMVYLTPEGHQRLKLLAARRNLSMGKVMEELVERELTELGNPWTGPDGLLLQQAALAKAWSDPALDVYYAD
jgi:hypothetical protein